MNILEVQDLCKIYGRGENRVYALRHGTFSVRKGEFVLSSANPAPEKVPC